MENQNQGSVFQAFSGVLKRYAYNMALNSDNFLKTTFAASFGLGIICIFLYSTYTSDGKCLLIGTLLLTAAAAFMCGFFLGFLFGIPKHTPSTNSNAVYNLNNNLIDISDWLTKIIIGLGLVEIKTLPGKLENLGKFVATCLSDCNIDCPASIALFATSLIVFFSVFGVYYGYNYVRLILSKEYHDADKILLEEKRAKEIILNTAIDSYTDSFNSSDSQVFEKIESLRASIRQKLEKAGNTDSFTSRDLSYSKFVELLSTAKQKMQSGISLQSSRLDPQLDPNKGQWGGKSESKDRRVTAKVSPFEANNDFFRIELTVESTNTNNPLLDGELVLFSLHNSFPDPYKIVVAKGGCAKLEIISYGAFTVGVLLDNGDTELEYDLETIPGAPEKFKTN